MLNFLKHIFLVNRRIQELIKSGYTVALEEVGPPYNPSSVQHAFVFTSVQMFMYFWLVVKCFPGPEPWKSIRFDQVSENKIQLGWNIKSYLTICTIRYGFNFRAITSLKIKNVNAEESSTD